MPGSERVGSAYVDIGVNDAPAIEGLKRLRAEADRQFAELGRKKAEAQLKLKSADFDKKIDAAKKQLDYFKSRRASATLNLAKKHFDEQVAAAQAELKALNDQRATIRVDARQVRAAHEAERLLNKERELSTRTTAKATAAATKNAETLRKSQFEVDKLRARYNKLANDAARLEQKAGRPGGLFHTEKERLELARLRSEMALTEHRVRSFGGTVEDIVPDLEDGESWIRRWGDSLAHTRLHLGFFSASVKQLAVGLVALGPILTGLVGSTVSVIGVLGTGLAGAAAVGGAGIAGLVASAVGAMLIIKPVIGEIGEVMKLQEGYSKAVLKYGKGSEKAGKAQEKLASGLREIAPGARAALKEWQKLKEAFRERTGGPARKAIFGGFAESVKTAKALMPSFAKESVNGIQTVASEWDKWMQKLRSGEGKQGIETIMHNLNKALPPLLNGFESLGAAIGRITVSASKFLPSLNRGFAQWAQGFEDSIGSGEALDRKIERLIGHMRDFGHLSQATGRLLITLLNTSADSGDGLLKSLTRTFNKWNEWMKTVEGQESLNTFFAEAADETRQLFTFLGRLIQLLWEMGRATAPISAGLFDALNVLGDFVQALAELGPMRDLLKTIGIILGGIWAVGKVQAFAGAVRDAAAALRGLAAAEGLAGAASASSGAGLATATATATGAAGGAFARRGPEAISRNVGLGESAAMGATAGAGVWGGAKVLSKRVLASKFATGGALAAGYFTAEFGAKLTEKLTGSNFLEGQSVWSSLLHGFNTDDVAKTEMQGLIKGELKIMGGRAAEALRSGFITRMPDINKTFAKASAAAAKAFGENTPGWRKAMARNIEAAVSAIKSGMEQGVIATKAGQQRIQQLMQRLKLITGGQGSGRGNDPFGIATGFVSGWEKAGKVSDSGINKTLAQMRTMPPQARALALKTMLSVVKEYERGGKLAKGTFSRLRSAIRTEMELIKNNGVGQANAFALGFGNAFNGLANTVSGALANIGLNLQQALSNMGIKAPHFNVKKLVQKLPQLPPLEKQHGGFIVPGQGSGDKVYRELPHGSFVMNREATAAHGFQSGGTVSTLLEPKERVFMPKEVRQIGPERLAAMNAAVPRQKGGALDEKLQKRAEHLWHNAAPFYGAAGHHMPLLRISKYPALHHAYAQTFDAKGLGHWVSVSPETARGIVNNTDDLGSLLHEWTHVFQRGVSKRWEKEGGADDMKRYISKKLFGHELPSRSRKYARYAHRVLEDKGWPWVKYGEFGKSGPPLRRQGGGMIGPEPALQGPPGSLHDLGQATIHRAYQGATQYLDAHRPHGPGSLGASVPTGPIQKMAREMVAQIWGGGQWRPFAALETQEAGWNPRAQNPSSGAAGLAQALPPSKYPPGAWPYRGPQSAKLQLQWMMSYIKQRYGSPAGAWAHEQAAGWYKHGGFVNALKDGGFPEAWRGTGPSGLQSGIHNMAAYLMGRYPGLSVSSTTGGTHATNSLHYSGQAVDLVGGGMDSIGSWISSNLYHDLAEGIHNPTLTVKGGEHVPSSVWGQKTWNDHKDHIHLGVTRPWHPVAGGSSGVSGKKPKGELPKAVKAAYTTYNTNGGNISGVRHHDNVALDIPSFGAIPDNEGGIKRELQRVEKVLLPKYKAAYNQYKRDHPEIAKKLNLALHQIEKRIRELRAALRGKRTEKARKRIQRRLRRKLTRLLGRGEAIESAEADHERAEEYAQQVVELEPEQPGELTHDWIERTFEPYINEREAPAYGAVLDREAQWRNVALDSEGMAKRYEQGWESAIGYPENRRPSLVNPDLHWPPHGKDQSATGLAKVIYYLDDEIQKRRHYINSHSNKWFSAHPNAAELRRIYRDQLPAYRSQLSIQEAVRAQLVENLGEGREQAFDWFKGSGPFEDSMVSVQGMHWPDQHERLDVLPTTPEAGRFGGAIFSTQQAIQELGLKIKQAKEGAEAASGTSGPSLAEQTATYNELREDLYRQFASNITGQTTPLPRYVGAFASGGILGTSGYALVGERGPELAYLPGGTHITNNERTKEVLNSKGTVNEINNYFSSPPPDPHTWTRQQEFELGALA
jgi:hypothetical protein